MNNSEAIGAE